MAAGVTPESAATQLIGEAEEACRLADVNPQRALAVGADVLARAHVASAFEAAAVAEQALGLAWRQAGDIGKSIAHLRRAVRSSNRAGCARRAALARMSLAASLALAGRNGAALAEIESAAGVLHGVDAARLLMQRAGIVERLGRFDEALRSLGTALRIIKRQGDVLWEARLHNNRAVLHVQRGSFGPASRDFEQAGMLFRALGADALALQVSHNLGWMATRQGALTTALQRFEEAEAEARRLETPTGIHERDRAEALLSARLPGEALQVAQRAAAEFERLGCRADLADARLIVSRAALLSGDHTLARDSARSARRAFVAQRRPVWAALADPAALRAEWATGKRSAATARTARRVATALGEAGLSAPALDALVLAGRIELERGRTDLAAVDLAQASKARLKGPVELRAAAWHAEALLRLARDNRRGTTAALRAGLHMLDRHRFSLGASELRAHASGHGEDLARLGLALAVETGRPEQVLAWGERWRAGALRAAPVRPPEDRGLAAPLAELRSLVADVQEAAVEGRPTAALLRRQAALEEHISREARTTSGTGNDDGGGAAPDVTELRRALNGAALVELVENAATGDLLAVTLTDRRLRLHHLGPATEVQRELDALHFSLRRLGQDQRRPALSAAAVENAVYAAGRLNNQLLAPLAAEIADRRVVLVPTASLHALPWSMLPGLRDNPVTVAPSAAVWLRAHDRPAVRDAPTVLVAGPGLAGADAEVTELAGMLPDASVLCGEVATVAAVCSALDGAGLAHLACHGSFRADNPLFSCLTMADGGLTVHDIEALGRAPETMVMSACESALTSVHPGDELMGLSASLLALGARTLVASVVKVPDAQTRTLMADLHRNLHAGRSPAEALFEARRAVGVEPVAMLASAAFSCFGAG